jgi:hypothetical protein
MSSFINFLISNPLLLAVVILGVVCIIQIVLVVIMYIKLRKFLVGIDSKHIGDSLTSVSSDLKDMKDFREDLEKYLTTVEKRLKKSVQSVNTVRFNPFKGTGGGGNQSFSTAFLNEEGDGVVISSLYSRDHVSVFSKPVKKLKSEFELSEEEKMSIKGETPEQTFE